MGIIEAFFIGLIVGIVIGVIVALWRALRTIDNFYATKDKEE